MDEDYELSRALPHLLAHERELLAQEFQDKLRIKDEKDLRNLTRERLRELNLLSEDDITTLINYYRGDWSRSILTKN